MDLGNDLVKLLSNTYEPRVLLTKKFKGNDIAFKTDADGNPILLFIGRANEEGQIKGERYARTLKYGPDGKVIKDHWELKGKAT